MVMGEEMIDEFERSTRLRKLRDEWAAAYAHKGRVREWLRVDDVAELEWAAVGAWGRVCADELDAWEALRKAEAARSSDWDRERSE